MTDRRDVPPEWPAPRAGWEQARHARSDHENGYAGYDHGPARTGYAAAAPAYPPRHTSHAPARARTRVRRADASRWHWLLLVPIVLPLIPGIYNRLEPALFGIPFFFWGQLAFAFVASAIITVVHLMVR